MKFQYKCALQRLFSTVPRGEYLNYMMQRYVSGTLPQSKKKFLERYAAAEKHFKVYRKYIAKEPADSSCYEFGAGWDLMFPLVFSRLGFGAIHCVDIRRLVIPLLVNQNLSYLDKMGNGGGMDGFPDRIRVNSRNLFTVLQNDFRIQYRAPVDARETGLPKGSIDFFYSNNTLEHIPKEMIVPILKECGRLMPENGIASLAIDYSDHWASFDRSISVYNYLRYEESEWKKYNPALQYQNRLRHSDYRRMIEESGFEIVEDLPTFPSDAERERLKSIPLAKPFQSYSADDLAITGSWIVMKKII